MTTFTVGIHTVTFSASLTEAQLKTVSPDVAYRVGQAAVKGVTDIRGVVEVEGVAVEWSARPTSCGA